jgi:hypothetical protein
MAALARACLDRGLVLLVVGNRIHVAPRLNVNDKDVPTGLAILDEALAESRHVPAVTNPLEVREARHGTAPAGLPIFAGEALGRQVAEGVNRLAELIKVTLAAHAAS